MRRAEDIHSMIDYLTAKGGCESDIAILKWVLCLDKSEWEQKYDEEHQVTLVMAAAHKQEVEALLNKLSIQDRELRRLKSLPENDGK